MAGLCKRGKTLLYALNFLILVLCITLVVSNFRFSTVSGQSSLSLASGEQRVLELVNAERGKTGLSQLSVAEPLVFSARDYAGYMAKANFFGHVGPDGSSAPHRNEAYGYDSDQFRGENLAAGQKTPEQVMTDWMKSDGHRLNILSPYADEIGVGYATGGYYGYYWVQEFGSHARKPTQQQSWTSPTTGYAVTGPWLNFILSNGGVDSFGLARSGIVNDPQTGQKVQFFQRAVLEYHPQNSPTFQIQRRLLGDILYPGFEPPVGEKDAPPDPSKYFPITPGQTTGLGHFVSNYSQSGQPLYFLDYFLDHGGITAFGYPKEVPKIRNGRWTQRFQAAVFEYHPENDKEPTRNYRVQLELLGDEYITQKNLPYR